MILDLVITQVTYIQWLKYWYKILPMGVANSPNIFQQKMNHLFQGFRFIRD